MDLHKTLESLPTLSERLQTWNKIIKELDQQERSNLESAILELSNPLNELSDFISYKELCDSFYSNYENLFKSLLSRLNVASLAYKEKIDSILAGNWSLKVKQFRIDEFKKSEDRALKYANDYFNQFNNTPSIVDKVKFKKEAEWMITTFLFQTPYLGCDSSKPGGLERAAIFHKEFIDWDPNYFVKIFHKRMNELFK